MKRLVAVESGGDWADASVIYLAVPNTVDLDKAKLAWRVWYNQHYVPELRADNQPRFRNFPDFLVEEYGAELNPIEIEVYQDL